VRDHIAWFSFGMATPLLLLVVMLVALSIRDWWKKRTPIDGQHFRPDNPSTSDEADTESPT